MTTTRRMFLQQLGRSAAGLSLVPLFPGCRCLCPVAAKTSLPGATPEAVGINSAGVQAFVEAAQSKHELHSFMVVRHGRMAASGWWAPYGPDFVHTLYSMSKSFTSTAVGLAVAEGRLRVDDPVVSFFPEDRPASMNEHLAALRVKHLLSMASGHEKEPTSSMVKEENWAKTFLAAPITHPPGSVFMYNSGATYMLSAIVQKVTGQKVVDYLRPRLFAPLGIDQATWETCPRGINVGGWGLSVTTESLAKLGELYLRQGVWRGRRLLSADWVNEATTFKIQQPPATNSSRPAERDDWHQGYCYQFWRCTHHAFRGDGAFGQFTVVLPEKDAVVIMTAESHDLQGQLDLVWDHLLPAMQAQPLAANSAAQTRLNRTLAGLALPLPKGRLESPLAARRLREPHSRWPRERGGRMTTRSN